MRSSTPHTPVSLLRRFLAEWVYFSLVGYFLLEGGKANPVSDNLDLFLLVFATIILSGFYNPIGYFFDARLIFPSSGFFGFLVRSTIRNSLRTGIFLGLALKPVLDHLTATNENGNTIPTRFSAEPIDVFGYIFLIIYALYVIDKLGALRFSNLTFLDDLVKTVHSKY